ncbi:VOC family protein [Niallia taxi]|uniref:VOC family protein n=1 Tax=Niallia taxi TaxID=2499688 RepID=UPI00119CB62E|nr:VOC family protein [Niallia taxi]MDE5051635.1 VOC family protein [Niallia taxi]MED3964902.1 VOC family protein [Niallia taxi]
MTKITPFLMFQGNAEEAIRFYTTIIEDSSIKNVIRYGKDEAGEEGSVMQAVFTLKNQEFMCIDSNIAHDFGFTPSFSIYVECETEEQIDHYYQAFVSGGQELMALGDYSFSRKFGWIIDKYGVSWQFTLPFN